MSSAARNVHRARPDQIDALLAFQAEAYGAESLQADRARLEWMYMRGGAADDGPSILVFELRGKIVGQIGLIPCEVDVDGRTLRGHWVPDLMVLREYRRLGVGVHLLDAAEALGDVAMASGVSDDLLPSLRRRGWFELGNLPLWALPANPAPLLQPMIAARAPTPALASLVSTVAGVAGRAARPLSRAVMEVVGASARHRLATVQPEEVESLWRRVARSDWIATPRTADWVAARFNGRPGGYTLLGAFDGDACVGYAAFRSRKFEGHPRFGDARIGMISDALAENARAKRAVLSAAASELMGQGCDLVLYGGLQPGADRLAPLPWIPVRVKWFPMFWARDEDVRRRMMNRQSWFMTRADGDGDAGF